MKQIFAFVFLLLLWGNSYCQGYEDYIGAGHNEGISVSSSDQHTVNEIPFEASGYKTMDGTGLEAKLMEAARFLSQATFGAGPSLVEEVAEKGIENWIDEQFEMEAYYLLPELINVYNTAVQIYTDNGGNIVNYEQRPEYQHVDYAWWQVNMTAEDLLRQRVAFSLNQILVISADSDLFDVGEALADYYDILIRHSFGNFRDLLLEVSLHPAMGVYLSHLNNPRAIPDQNIHPDENYAREIMQLFTIGLFQLNQDGSRKIDGNGAPIPTYDNEDIRELAKVFTGLGAGGTISKNDQLPPQFNLGMNAIDFTVPMKMYPDWHEAEEKILLKSLVIPEGQDGMTDIEMAVDFLFNHPNVGPFIGRQLIQRMVKSNPSPEYISRIAGVFDDNGNGVRGDMKSVIKAILMDVEARSCEWMNDNKQGRLREPITRYTQFAKAVGTDNDANLYWNFGTPFMSQVGQHPFHSQTVFNFYLPDFQPNGALADEDLVGPEFQIHNTKTSIGYLNAVDRWSIDGELLFTQEEGTFLTRTEFEKLLPYAGEPEALINRLDILLTNGQLSDNTREIITTAIEGFNSNSLGNLKRLKLALYLFMISPDYAVIK